MLGVGIFKYEPIPMKHLCNKLITGKTRKTNFLPKKDESASYSEIEERLRMPVRCAISIVLVVTSLY